MCDRKLRYSKFRHLRNNPKRNKTNILLFFLLKTYFPVMNLLIACQHVVTSTEEVQEYLDIK